MWASSKHTLLYDVKNDQQNDIHEILTRDRMHIMGNNLVWCITKYLKTTHLCVSRIKFWCKNFRLHFQSFWKIKYSFTFWIYTYKVLFWVYILKLHSFISFPLYFNTPINRRNNSKQITFTTCILEIIHVIAKEKVFKNVLQIYSLYICQTGQVLSMKILLFVTNLSQN